MLKENCKKYLIKKVVRPLVIISVAFLTVFFVSVNTVAQCSGFAKAVVKPELSPFLHDGNYNATILGEGETIVLRKTVFKGQKYRLLVKGVPELPKLHFRVLDANSGLLFDNSQVEFASSWDFDVQTTRTIEVEVSVPDDENPEIDTGGCVAILFGLELD
ncbi:hypothetical protein [Marinilabilia salmonicolor]|uniref:hypothetical protein n=1 Tax=Marinilabilia salmonicolor TaxID=989 RepID=UPI00029A8C71|nr:hypothetical protein [Marinilabilia salmonicolor]